MASFNVPNVPFSPDQVSIRSRSVIQRIHPDYSSNPDFLSRPSGKHHHNYGKIHHAIHGKLHYFDWAMFNLSMVFQLSSPSRHQRPRSPRLGPFPTDATCRLWVSKDGPSRAAARRKLREALEEAPEGPS